MASRDNAFVDQKAGVVQGQALMAPQAAHHSVAACCAICLWLPT
jgi:hypothetical protein